MNTIHFQHCKLTWYYLFLTYNYFTYTYLKLFSTNRLGGSHGSHGSLLNQACNNIFGQLLGWSTSIVFKKDTHRFIGREL